MYKSCDQIDQRWISNLLGTNIRIPLLTAQPVNDIGCGLFVVEIFVTSCATLCEAQCCQSKPSYDSRPVVSVSPTGALIARTEFGWHHQHHTIHRVLAPEQIRDEWYH